MPSLLYKAETGHRCADGESQKLPRRCIRENSCYVLLLLVLFDFFGVVTFAAAAAAAVVVVVVVVVVVGLVRFFLVS